MTQALKYTPLSLRNCIEPIKNSLCREGNSLNSNANGNVNATGSMEKIPGNVIVYGGFNGGGVASMNIKTAVPHCGGGGGAVGGNSALNDFSLDIDIESHPNKWPQRRKTVKIAVNQLLLKVFDQ